MRTQDPMRNQDPRRTQESRRTKDPMRTKDPTTCIICFEGILRSVHKPKFKLYIAFNTNLLSLH